jgi:hypothetical protein
MHAERHSLRLIEAACVPSTRPDRIGARESKPAGLAKAPVIPVLVEGIAMHFALLLSHLPHVDDARAQYPDNLVPAAKPHFTVRMARAIWSAVLKLAS